MTATTAMHPIPLPWAVSQDFGASTGQVGGVRRFVAGTVSGHPCADDVVLLASELATNAAQYGACAALTVQVQHLPACVRISIGQATPPRLSGNVVMPDPDREDGRGLPLVDALAEDWGVARDEHHVWQVWCRVACRCGLT